jgi:hypothetical protein
MKNTIIGIVFVMEVVSVPLVMHLLSTYTSLTTAPILLAAFLTSIGSFVVFAYVMNRMGL